MAGLWMINKISNPNSNDFMIHSLNYTKYKKKCTSIFFVLLVDLCNRYSYLILIFVLFIYIYILITTHLSLDMVNKH